MITDIKHLRRFRSAKIIATLGPQSSDIETIKTLVVAGADVFRLNMSHGTQNEHAVAFHNIRAVEKELHHPIGILSDLQGPKLRIGAFKKGSVVLENGQTFTLDKDPALGSLQRVTLPHPEIFDVAREGDTLLLDDGKIKLRIQTASSDTLVTRVETGGLLSDSKGLNVPDITLPFSAISEKDIENLHFSCEIAVDWIALSFVQRPEDIIEARELIQGRALIIAKIEKPQAVMCLNSILLHADGVMVARGDLGVELAIENVPLIQKKIVSAARRMGKPVIVATQMLESMISSPVPTRAEVSDIANAVCDGADALMLSAETAVGAYAVDVIQTMDRIIISVENDTFYRKLVDAARTKARDTPSDAITAAAREVAEIATISAICTITKSGATAMRCARERPCVPIMVLTSLTKTARRLCLFWGLQCIVTHKASQFKDAVREVNSCAKSHNFSENGDKIIVTAGIPFDTPGTTNILRILTVSDYIDDSEFLP